MAGKEATYLVLLLILTNLFRKNTVFPILIHKAFLFCVPQWTWKEKIVNSFAKTVRHWWKSTGAFKSIATAIFQLLVTWNERISSKGVFF